MVGVDFWAEGRLKRIDKHTDEQLDLAINRAITKCPDFYILLHGIDAYMERRNRRKARREERKNACLHDMIRGDIQDNWGDNGITVTSR